MGGSRRPGGSSNFVIDLAKTAVRASMEVPDGEPGRVELDDARAYVARRRGGLAVIDLASGTLVDRVNGGPAPRGLAVDGDSVVVACAGGLLIRINTTTLQEVSQTPIAPDVRDVRLPDSVERNTTCPFHSSRSTTFESTSSPRPKLGIGATELGSVRSRPSRSPFASQPESTRATRVALRLERRSAYGPPSCCSTSDGSPSSCARPASSTHSIVGAP